MGVPTVVLEVNWPDNRKVMAVGLEGAGLHATALCLAKRMESDGWLHQSLLMRYGATEALLDRLVSVGLLDVDGERYLPHDWHARNFSQAAIDARRASKCEAGRAGNHARYKHPGPLAECAKCQPDTQGARTSDRNGSQPSRTASGSDRSSSLSFTTTTSTYTPPEVPDAANSNGGGDVINEAARLLAEAEADRRDSEIANRTGYIRARTPAIRKDHEPAWRSLLAASPSMTAADLAAIGTPASIDDRTVKARLAMMDLGNHQITEIYDQPVDRDLNLDAVRKARTRTRTVQLDGEAEW